MIHSSKILTLKRYRTMAMNFVKKLPIPAEVKKMYPLSDRVVEIKKKRDAEIRDVFTGASDKFILIIGPCSADNVDSVLDYIHRLAKIQDKIGDRILLIPRIYTNKPRTTGEGYKGLVHQPDPEKKPDVFAGIVAMRKLHADAIEQTGLTCADEMLYPENYRYVDDLLSYVAIGARSVEDQHHRMTVSGMTVPAGMKNPTSGDLSVMFNSVKAAQSRHNFIYRGWEVYTDGNDLAHVVLRGATNKHGEFDSELPLRGSDADERAVWRAWPGANPAAIIDTNHSNSGKQYIEQIRIAKEVLHSMSYNPELKNSSKGFMIESYIEDGAQKIGTGNHVYGSRLLTRVLDGRSRSS